MKFLTKKKKTADKEIAAGRDDEKQEVQNQTEDDMDEESLANGRDNVIEVKRTMGKKGRMLLAIAAIVGLLHYIFDIFIVSSYLKNIHCSPFLLQL